MPRSQVFLGGGPLLWGSQLERRRAKARWRGWSRAAFPLDTRLLATRLLAYLWKSTNSDAQSPWRVPNAVRAAPPSKAHRRTRQRAPLTLQARRTRSREQPPRARAPRELGHVGARAHGPPTASNARARMAPPKARAVSITAKAGGAPPPGPSRRSAAGAKAIPAGRRDGDAPKGLLHGAPPSAARAQAEQAPAPSRHDRQR